jgi:hypothetical protein
MHSTMRADRLVPGKAGFARDGPEVVSSRQKHE